MDGAVYFPPWPPSDNPPADNLPHLSDLRTSLPITHDAVIGPSDLASDNWRVIIGPGGGPGALSDTRVIGPAFFVIGPWLSDLGWWRPITDVGASDNRHVIVQAIQIG